MFLLAIATTVRATPSTCQSDEEVLFSCDTKGRHLSICASSDWSAERGYLQYRYGTSEHAELALPVDRDTTPSRSASAGMLTLAGGGGAYLRFKGPKVDYFVYSAVSATMGEKSGVAIERDGQEIGSVQCKANVKSSLGPALFQRGRFPTDESDFVLPLR